MVARQSMWILRTSPERGPGEDPGTTKPIQATLRTEDVAAILGESVVFRLSREPAPEPGVETMKMRAVFRENLTVQTGRSI